jgi:hypothetical protein
VVYPYDRLSRMWGGRLSLFRCLLARIVLPPLDTIRSVLSLSLVYLLFLGTSVAAEEVIICIFSPAFACLLLGICAWRRKFLIVFLVTLFECEGREGWCSVV